jgi:hypothetical protein
MSELLALLIRLGQSLLFLSITVAVFAWLISVAWPILVALLVLGTYASLDAYAKRVEEAIAKRNAPKSWWRRWRT